MRERGILQSGAVLGRERGGWPVMRRWSNSSAFLMDAPSNRRQQPPPYFAVVRAHIQGRVKGLTHNTVVVFADLLKQRAYWVHRAYEFIRSLNAEKVQPFS